MLICFAHSLLSLCTRNVYYYYDNNVMHCDFYITYKCRGEVYIIYVYCIQLCTWTVAAEKLCIYVQKIIRLIQRRAARARLKTRHGIVSWRGGRPSVENEEEKETWKERMAGEKNEKKKTKKCKLTHPHVKNLYHCKVAIV